MYILPFALKQIQHKMFVEPATSKEVGQTSRNTLQQTGTLVKTTDQEETKFQYLHVLQTAEIDANTNKHILNSSQQVSLQDTSGQSMESLNQDGNQEVKNEASSPINEEKKKGKKRRVLFTKQQTYILEQRFKQSFQVKRANIFEIFGHF